MKFVYLATGRRPFDSGIFLSIGHSSERLWRGREGKKRMNKVNVDDLVTECLCSFTTDSTATTEFAEEDCIRKPATTSIIFIRWRPVNI